MKMIQLVPGITSSVIGLGCAPVLGSVDASTSKRIIHLCLDHGINHFDLARSYGFGKAEALVGKVLHNRRSNVVLASKFGYKASFIAQQLGFLKPAVRRLKQFMAKKSQGSNENRSPSHANFGHLLKPVIYNKKEMIKSLETSLIELRTDYLDYYFLHDPVECIRNIDEIFETADRFKSEGKIKAFGISYSRKNGNLHAQYMNNFDLQQSDLPPFDLGYTEVVSKRKSDPNIFFSLLRGRLGQNEPRDILLKIRQDFPNSVFLISMFNESHLMQNISHFN